MQLVQTTSFQVIMESSSSYSAPVDRSRAGSLVVKKPKKEPFEERSDGGNLQLMEAKLLELYSSIRKLHASNQELQDALEESPGDEDFIDARKENAAVIQKQRSLAMELITDMKRQGAQIDLPADISALQYVESRQVEENLDDQSQQQTETETGVYL